MFFDQNILDYADKCKKNFNFTFSILEYLKINNFFFYKDCLENQTLNLKYLLWYCLVNTDIKLTSNEIHEIPPYCKKKINKHFN